AEMSLLPEDQVGTRVTPFQQITVSAICSSKSVNSLSTLIVDTWAALPSQPPGPMRVGFPGNTPKAALVGPGKAKAPSCPSVSRSSDSRRAAIMETYWAPMSKTSRLTERPANRSWKSALKRQASSSMGPAGAGAEPAGGPQHHAAPAASEMTE